MTVNQRYMLLQGFFWMQFCVSYGFVSLYLQARGLSTGAIGIVTAASGVSAAVLQPVLGRLCDRYEGLTWQLMLMLLCPLYCIVCAVMPLIPGTLSGGVMLCFMMLLSSLMMPFVNSAGLYYQQRGDKLNFGVARGIGSGLYAILALVLGGFSARFGADTVPFAGIAVSAALFAIICFMPCEFAAAPAEVGKKQKNGAGLLRKYPSFALMLAASLMMFTSHNMTSTYLLQIMQSLGGGSGQLGRALAIQAIVEVPVLFCFSALLKRFRPAALMLAAALGYAAKAVMYAVSGSVAMIYATQLTQMFSFALFASASVYFAAEAVSPENQTTGQSLMTSMIAAGSVLGSLCGGYLIELSGIPLMLTVNVAASLVGVLLAFASVHAAAKRCGAKRCGAQTLPRK